MHSSTWKSAPGATCTSTNTTPSRTSAWCWGGHSTPLSATGQAFGATAMSGCGLGVGGRGYADFEPRPDPLAGANVWLELLPHFVETLAHEARFAVHLEVRQARSTHHLVEGGVSPAPGRRQPQHEGDAAVIAVVDFGAGNIRSVLRALLAVGAEARLVRRPEQVADADRLAPPRRGGARAG